MFDILMNGCATYQFNSINVIFILRIASPWFLCAFVIKLVVSQSDMSQSTSVWLPVSRVHLKTKVKLILKTALHLTFSLNYKILIDILPLCRDFFLKQKSDMDYYMTCQQYMYCFQYVRYIAGTGLCNCKFATINWSVVKSQLLWYSPSQFVYFFFFQRKVSQFYESSSIYVNIFWFLYSSVTVNCTS